MWLWYKHKLIPATILLPEKKNIFIKSSVNLQGSALWKILVELSFEFLWPLRFCVYVRKVKNTAQSSASRPSGPLSIMSEVTWSMWITFSTFHHQGCLPTLLRCNQKDPLRISAGTQTTLTEIVRVSPQSLSLQKYVRTATASFPNRLISIVCPFRVKVLYTSSLNKLNK